MAQDTHRRFLLSFALVNSASSQNLDCNNIPIPATESPTLTEIDGFKVKLQSFQVIAAPEYVNGVNQIPMQGTNLVYILGDADAGERHTPQCFEMIDNRGLYNEGWFARVIQSTLWSPHPRYPITSK